MEIGESKSTPNTEITREKAFSLLLNLCFSRHAIQYSVLELNTKQFIDLGTITTDKEPNQLNISASLQKIPYANLDFKHTVISVCSNQYTLVPEPYFSEKSKSEIYSLTESASSNETIYSDYIKSLDGYVIYALNNSFVNQIKAIFPKAILIHAISANIEAALITNKPKTNSELYLIVNEKTVDIIVAKSGNLILSASHIYESNEDIAYYLLLTMDQLQLSLTDTTVTFPGKSKKHDALIDLLKTYISTIEFPSCNPYIPLISESNTDNNIYFSVLNQYRFKV